MTETLTTEPAAEFVRAPSLASPRGPWNDTTDAELRRLYGVINPTLSMRRIAEILTNIGCIVTKGAVIGRVHRLDLPKRGQARPDGHKYKPRARKPQFSAAGKRLPLNLLLEELRGRTQCRYPFGEGPPFRFCALPVVPGCSWCPEHARVVFRQTPAWIDRSRGARR